MALQQQVLEPRQQCRYCARWSSTARCTIRRRSVSAFPRLNTARPLRLCVQSALNSDAAKQRDVAVSRTPLTGSTEAMPAANLERVVEIASVSSQTGISGSPAVSRSSQADKTNTSAQNSHSQLRSSTRQTSSTQRVQSAVAKQQTRIETGSYAPAILGVAVLAVGALVFAYRNLFFGRARDAVEKSAKVITQVCHLSRKIGLGKENGL